MHRLSRPNDEGSAGESAGSSPSNMLAMKNTSLPAATMSNTRFNFQSRHPDSPMAPSSVASQYDVQHYVIKSSVSLPVLVNEALSTSGSRANTSVQFSKDGWAWLISNMKLFVWKIRQATSKCICKELILDSGPNKQYHAQLALVGHCQNGKSEGIVSALALTADGYVTFWPNIIRSVTSAVYLDGPELAVNEEFLRILPLKGKGYLAVTTNGDLYELSPDGYSIACTQLRRSIGVFAGIGRRMSSLFFNQDCHMDVVNLVLLQTSAACCDIILLTARSMQRRKVCPSDRGGCYNQLICQADIKELFMDAISQEIWGNSRKDFTILPMDVTMDSRNNDIAVLVACSEHQSGKNKLLRYCICICRLSVLGEARDDALSSSPVDIVLLNHTDILLNGNELGHHSFKLIIPNVSSRGLRYAIIWRSDKVIIKSLRKDSRTHEEFIPIEPTDTIIGAGEFDTHAVLFESTNGLLSVEPVQLAEDVSFCEAAGSMMDSPNISRDHVIPDQLSSIPNTSKVLKEKRDEVDSGVHQAQHLQSAFIHFNQLNISRARSIIHETFRGTDRIESFKDAVISMSSDIIDDFPALDPRWAESLPQENSSSSSSSLILQHQLRDKQKAHQLFLSFLTEVSLWDLLGSPVSAENGQNPCVQWTLIEHQEKLEAAVALANKHVEKQGIFDSGIKRVIEKRGNYINNSELTTQDTFFRQVSQIQDIFQGILDIEEEAISNSSMSSRELCRMIVGANEIFETMLTAVHGLRKHRGIYHKDRGIEFCPWTVSSGHDSVREALLRQHLIIFTHGIPEADDAQCRSTLHMHAVVLADILLSEYQWQMESLVCAPSLSARLDEVTELFQGHRTATITPILEAGLVEKAAVLSEKFKDFNILMEIWDRKDNEILLSEYVTKFEKFGFVDSFFAWLLERGKFRKLLCYATCEAIASTEFTKRTFDFMSSHPRINWLYQIKTNDLLAAHKTLLYLAVTESRSSAVKNHYVSLSKLTAAFSDECQSVTEKAIVDSNSQQALLKYQETLPSAVLEIMDVTSDNMPVLSAEELIRLYICEHNVQANEIDFMKALDLLSFIPQSLESHCQAEDGSDHDTASEIVNLKHLIWCKAILQDSWHDIDCGVDNLKSSSHTILAKTLALASQSGMLLNCLPNMEQLLEQEPLTSVKNNASSQYLVRLNFKHYERQVLAA